MKYSEYSHANRRTIDKIITVKEFNADSRPEDRCPKNYGYIMPIYHGYQWKATKKQLIEMFTY